MSLRIASFLVLLLPTASSRCTLCFDGTDPPELALVIEAYKPLSCGALAKLAILATDSCEDWLEPGRLCGCPNPFGEQELLDDGYRYIDENDGPRGGLVRRRGRL